MQDGLEPPAFDNSDVEMIFVRKHRFLRKIVSLYRNRRT
jgi:hypothetical protein